MASSLTSSAKGVHAVRFRRWQNLCPPQTRSLSNLVDSILVERIIEHGFCRIDFSFGQPDELVLGSEIELERRQDGYVDSVRFIFCRVSVVVPTRSQCSECDSTTCDGHRPLSSPVTLWYVVPVCDVLFS